MLYETASHSVLDDSASLLLASYLKAVADPLRITVLGLLRQDSFAVLELCHILSVKQSALSHHLKILAQAGLVITRREGNTIFYRRAAADAADSANSVALQQALFLRIDAIRLPAAVLVRLLEVQAERMSCSRTFFAQHASFFRQQQEQIADYDLYGPAMAALLDRLTLPNHACALEIGPGNGQFLGELAQRFARVCGLDNNAAMLALAADYVRAHKLGNVELFCGDISSLPNDFVPDCVVMNMVLHHTPSPAEVITAVGRSLSANACLLVCELCHHQQGWVREACGDIWLGFEPRELCSWLADAGLICESSQYLALRNGFQIQIHTTRQGSNPPTRSIQKGAK